LGPLAQSAVSAKILSFTVSLWTYIMNMMLIKLKSGLFKSVCYNN
jgi:hypothetical protein